MPQDGITNSILSDTLLDMSPAEFFSALLSTLVSAAIGIGGFIFFFILVRGAYKWMTAGSDKAAYQEARASLVTGFVGIVILLSSFAIIILIENIFGVSILNINIEPLYLI